jgi:hypothetical protein
MRRKIEVVVGMFVIGDLKWLNEAKFEQSIDRIVDSRLAHHREGDANTLENLGDRGVATVLNKRLADGVALRCRTFAGDFEVLKQKLDCSAISVHGSIRNNCSTAAW